MPASNETKSKPRGCPICGTAPEAFYRPFCSSRCANVDLSRWLRGAYALPAENADDASSTEPEAEPSQEAGQRHRREL